MKLMARRRMVSTRTIEIWEDRAAAEIRRLASFWASFAISTLAPREPGPTYVNSSIV